MDWISRQVQELMVKYNTTTSCLIFFYHQLKKVAILKLACSTSD